MYYFVSMKDGFMCLRLLMYLFRDLKPHNLLMDPKTLVLKIADLGLARAFTLPIKEYTHEVLRFISPYISLIRCLLPLMENCFILIF